LPEPYFSLYPLYIYGPKVGLSSRKYAPKSVIVNNARIAASAQKLFDFIWDHTEVVPQGKKELEELTKKPKKNETP
jgi:hypothetical protein